MDSTKYKSFWNLVCIATVINVAQSANITSSWSLCNNEQSIERSRVCDRTVDCGDGSDENYTGKGFKCSLRTSIEGAKSTRCVLPRWMLLDDVADCIDKSDLCFDEKENVISTRCYQCLDRREVISLTQVCDGVVDCHDLSDECACAEKNEGRDGNGRDLLRNPICGQMRYSGVVKSKHQELVQGKVKDICHIGEIICFSINDTSTSFDSHTAKCISPSHVCDEVLDCPMGDDERFCAVGGYHCYGEENIFGTFCDGRVDCPNFDDECSENCWLPNSFCNNVTQLYDNSSVLQCEASNGTMNIHGELKGYHVCDGVIDCNETGYDEMNCLAATHFYCKGKSPLFIDWRKYLDGKRDCLDGCDECSELNSASRFKHLNHIDAILRSSLMAISGWVMCFFAIVGNTVVACQTLKELCKDWQEEKLGKLAKCNRILVLNLAFSDFLMGIYQLLIGISSVGSQGRYCANDGRWRSGLTCVVLGFINQLSNESSVLTLLLMTSFRLYGTMRPFKVESSQLVKTSVISCLVVWMLSLLVAIVPLLEAFSEYFIDIIWFPSPLVTAERVTKRELQDLVIRMNTVTYNVTGELSDYSWKTMLNFLREIDVKSKHPDWDLETLQPGGFYNQYAVCIPNLYSSRGETAWAYSAAIILFNFIAFCYISFAYVVIYKTSSRPAVRKSVRKQSRQWRKDSKTMQKKILLLVVTDVICWLPISIVAIINIVRPIQMKRDVVGVTAAFLLPINGAVNPLIYSSAFWEMLRYIKRKIRPKSKESIFNDSVNTRENVSGADPSPSRDQIRMRTVQFHPEQESSEGPSNATLESNHKNGTGDTTRDDKRRPNSLSLILDEKDIFSEKNESALDTPSNGHKVQKLRTACWRKPFLSESFEKETFL